jgi:hypothetical protein
LLSFLYRIQSRKFRFIHTVYHQIFLSGEIAIITNAGDAYDKRDVYTPPRVVRISDLNRGRVPVPVTQRVQETRRRAKQGILPDMPVWVMETARLEATITVMVVGVLVHLTDFYRADIRGGDIPLNNLSCFYDG